MKQPMTTHERLALIDRILDHSDTATLRDWASAWLEVLDDTELWEVRRAFVPQKEEATA